MKTYDNISEALGWERVDFIPDPKNENDWITHQQHEARRGKIFRKGSAGALLAMSFNSIVKTQEN